MLRGKMTRQIAGTADSCVLCHQEFNANDDAMNELASTLNDLIRALVRPIQDARNKGQVRAPDELKERVKALEE